MSHPAERGSAAIQRLLDTRLCDVRRLDVRGFGGWLQRHLAVWEQEPAFVQRSRIRELRRSRPELLALERERRAAEAEDRASPHFARLEELARDIAGAHKAVAGLSHALKSADAAEHTRLSAKLRQFRARALHLQREEAELAAASPARRALDAIRWRIDELRAQLGLDHEEARLRELQRAQGRSSGRTGTAFETWALEAIQRDVLPELAGGKAGHLAVLRGATLGAARMEIDQLVVRATGEFGAPVEVLALVEAKRNINDLAHGLRRRVENLAWLAGTADGYDAEQYRTASFPSGHFDAPATHHSGGERFRLTRESFRHFSPAAGPAALPPRVYLVTRTGPLWGLGSAAMARMAHRVSSDEAWDPGDPQYLGRLLEWCRGLAHPVEAPDVLAACAADEAAGRRVLLLQG